MSFGLTVTCSSACIQQLEGFVALSAFHVFFENSHQILKMLVISLQTFYIFIVPTIDFSFSFPLRYFFCCSAVPFLSPVLGRKNDLFGRRLGCVVLSVCWRKTVVVG